MNAIVNQDDVVGVCATLVSDPELHARWGREGRSLRQTAERPGHRIGAVVADNDKGGGDRRCSVFPAVSTTAGLSGGR